MEDVILYACKNCLSGTGYKSYSNDLSQAEKTNMLKISISKNF